MGNTMNKSPMENILNNEKIFSNIIEDASQQVKKRINELSLNNPKNEKYINCIIQVELDYKSYTLNIRDGGILCAMRIKPEYVKNIEDKILNFVQPHFPDTACDVTFDESITNKHHFSFCVKI